MLALLVCLVSLQGVLMSLFLVFSTYNYYYGLAALFSRKLPRVAEIGGKKTAVVICSFNEKNVLVDTISECEKLSYEGKVIIVADDSNDGVTAELLRSICEKKGCRPVTDPVVTNNGEFEILEMPPFQIGKPAQQERFGRRFHDGHRSSVSLPVPDRI